MSPTPIGPRNERLAEAYFDHGVDGDEDDDDAEAGLGLRRVAARGL